MKGSRDSIMNAATEAAKEIHCQNFATRKEAETAFLKETAKKAEKAVRAERAELKAQAKESREKQRLQAEAKREIFYKNFGMHPQNRLLNFGKYALETYVSAADKYPKYCQWVLKAAEENDDSAKELKDFACYLKVRDDARCRNREDPRCRNRKAGSDAASSVSGTPPAKPHDNTGAKMPPRPRVTGNGRYDIGNSILPGRSLEPWKTECQHPVTYSGQNASCSWITCQNCKYRLATAWKDGRDAFVGMADAEDEDEQIEVGALGNEARRVAEGDLETYDKYCGIWDSGCRKTVCGEEVLQPYLEECVRRGYPIEYEEKKQRFKFGNQGTLQSTKL